MSRRIDLWLILGLLVVSFALRALIVASYQFDGLYGQDPYAYFDFARAIVEGRDPGAFFWPLGYPALLISGFALFGVSAEIGQIINLLLGAALTPLVYILACQTGCGRFGAFVAGVLMLACGQALQSSLVIMSDIPTLFWTTLSAIFLLRYREINQVRWLALSALTLALACITRWLALSLALPWVLVVLWTWHWRVRWREWLLAAVAALIIFIPQILYSMSSPYPTLSHHWVEGWSPGNIFQREFNNVDGYYLYDQINAIFYAQVFHNAYYLAPIFAPFSLLGAGVILKQRRFSAAVILLGWLLIPYIFLVGIPYQNIRYPLILFPPAVVLVGVGMQAAVKWIQQVISRRQPGGAGLRSALIYTIYIGTAIFLVIGLAQTASASRPIIHIFITNQQRDRALADWTQTNVPPDATLYTFSVTLTLQHHTSLNVYEIYYETPETLAEHWRGESDNDYLLINLWDITHQWEGLAPQIAYEWLRDERGLTELARYGNYTLFKIGA
jgi:4-amino-4-deoxy-L-arabinose transferase-like glycosyltransferase